MTKHLPVNHYGYTYYYINEDTYIYGIPDNKIKGEKLSLEFSFYSLSLSFPFFILYNMKNLFY